MPLFVVAYPSFSANERAWIDRVRAKHDAAKHRLVPPHVTLVFGTVLSVEDGALVATHTIALGLGSGPRVG